MRKLLKITLAALLLSPAAILLPAGSPLVAQTTPATTPGYYNVPTATQAEVLSTASTSVRSAVAKLSAGKLASAPQSIKIPVTGIGRYTVAITITVKGKKIVIAKGTVVNESATATTVTIKLKATAAGKKFLKSGKKLKVKTTTSVKLVGAKSSSKKTGTSTLKP